MIDVMINKVIYDRDSSRYILAVISRTVWFGRRWKRFAWLWLDETGVGSSSLSERKEQPGASGSGKWREDEMRQDGTRELGTTKSLSSDEGGTERGRRDDEMRWETAMSQWDIASMRRCTKLPQDLPQRLVITLCVKLPENSQRDD